MGRIMAIDYGTKRCGIAVTDAECLVAGPLDTVAPEKAVEFIRAYHARYALSTIVVGLPKKLNQEETHSTKGAIEFKLNLEKALEGIVVEFFDERFTSKMALDSLVMTGASKKIRKNKGLLDQTSAVILLQSYMQAKGI